MSEPYRIEPNPVLPSSHRRLTDGQGQTVAILVPAALAPAMAQSPRMLAVCRALADIKATGCYPGWALHEVLREAAAVVAAVERPEGGDAPAAAASPGASRAKLYGPEPA